MRGTKIGIITLAAAGLVLAGCGGDDGDDTTPAASSSSSDQPSDDASSEGPAGDGGGEASGDLVDWAADFCGAVAPLQEQFVQSGGGIEIPTEVPTDPSALIEQLQAQFGEIAPAFDAARDAVESAGPPPIDGGDEVFDNMLRVLGAAADAFAEMGAQVAALDPNDPGALASLDPTLFQQMGEEMGTAGQELDATFSSPEMADAFTTAPGCDGLDLE